MPRNQEDTGFRSLDALKLHETLASVVSFRRKRLQQNISELYAEIETRRRLQQELCHAIEQDCTHVQNQIYALEPEGRATSQEGTVLAKLRTVLIQEKRHHAISCWQDVARLKQELRTQIREFGDILLEQSMLANTESLLSDHRAPQS